ncbi:MAG: glycosyl transferase [Deltaproteobacteria bacterium]|nr:glycosyl transferase [Deltaproteobacteria bacterium]
MCPLISIIIPARNDAVALQCTLDHLQQLTGIAGVEILVAASGDLRSTERAVAGRAQLIWPARSSRSGLMNSAADIASGDILFFLHADSLPPRDALARIHSLLQDPKILGGAFEHRFLETSWSLRVISWINRQRYRLTRNYYGDQGIFVRASVFRNLGGYRDLGLMEDLDLSQRLKRSGRTALIRSPLVTSGRRFVDRGPWRTFAFVVWLLFLHTLRLDTQRYARRWQGPPDRVPGSRWSRVRWRIGI